MKQQPPRVLSGPELIALVAEAHALLEQMVARGVGREVAMRAFVLAAVFGGAVGRPLDEPDELRKQLLEMISPAACKLMVGAVRDRLGSGGRA